VRGIIPLTKSEQQLDQGQRDRPVEVSAAMAAAGAVALYAADDDRFWGAPQALVEQLAIAAFAAMERARRLECSPPRGMRISTKP